MAGPASYTVTGRTEDSVMELRDGSPNRRIDQISPLGTVPVPISRGEGGFEYRPLGSTTTVETTTTVVDHLARSPIPQAD
jgi:hypothetical protein